MMDITQLKKDLDILSVAQPYCNGFTKIGKVYQAKNNPLRQEKTSSLYFYKDSQHYHDFGTGEHGDVIDFYKSVSGLSTKDTLQVLGLRKITQPLIAEIKRPESNPPPDLSGLFWRFESLSKDQNHRLELASLCPLWLLREADQDSIATFKQRVRYDRRNKTLVFSIENHQGNIVGLKRRRFKLYGEVKKWVAIKRSEANHSHIRLRSTTDPVFILEGVRDGLNGLLLGIDFIAIPSAHYKTFNPHELSILDGREVILIADLDPVGIECMQRLSKQIETRASNYFVLDLKIFLSSYYGNAFHPNYQGKIDFADAIRLYAETGAQLHNSSRSDYFKAQLLNYVRRIQQGDNSNEC